MKFTILFVFGLVAYAAAESEPQLPGPPAPSGVSEEGILSDLGQVAKADLKGLLNDVNTHIIKTAKYITTDGIQLNSTKEVKEALQLEVPSNEGVFEAIGNLILRQAENLSSQHAAEYEGSFSHEGIVGIYNRYRNIHKISEAEGFITASYNKTFEYDGPSHEGILGGLGGLVLHGLGNIIGGNAGEIINGVGDFVGNLFFAPPQFSISKEGIVSPQVSEEGIFSSVGKLILKGAGKFAQEILKGAFGSASNVLGNIFLARGNFYNHPNIQSAGHEIILDARHRIHQNHHPEAKSCLENAEHNLTVLFEDYIKNGHGCVAAAHPHGKRIIAHVEDIVLDAVKRVEDSHREIDFCFDKYIDENRVVCLNEDIPRQIAEHRQKIQHYGEDLADYVKQFSDLNTGFDVCLTGHLGVVRREVYHIVYDFHKCVSKFPKTKKGGILNGINVDVHLFS